MSHILKIWHLQEVFLKELILMSSHLKKTINSRIKEAILQLKRC